MRQQGSIQKIELKRRQNGKPVYAYKIFYRTLDGKNKKETCNSSQQAAARLREVITQIEGGSYREPVKITFREYAEQWLQRRVNLKGSTWANYESYLKRHVCPKIGGIKLSALRIEHIEGLVASLIQTKKIRRGGLRTYGSAPETTLKPKTIRHIIVMVRTMLRHAEERGYVRSNVAHSVELPKVVKPRIELPDSDTVRALLSEALTDEVRLIFLLDATTGLRRGELLALQWRDIDWIQQELVVERAIVKLRGSELGRRFTYGIGTTKSGKPRRVGLSSILLDKFRELHTVVAMKHGQSFSDTDFIFTRNQTFIDPEYFTKWIVKPLLKKVVGITRFHNLRHFFVSMLIADGVNPKLIQDQVGHASIQTTFDIYGHLMPGAKREAANRLANKLMQQEEQPVPVDDETKDPTRSSIH